jgi:hypothetical protein
VAPGDVRVLAPTSLAEDTGLASDTQEIALGLAVLEEAGDLRSRLGRVQETRAQRRSTRNGGRSMGINDPRISYERTQSPG